jgi:hypothetical protein
MNTRATRVARGWLVGVFATALAALSHAVAGGGTPSPLALGVGVVFAGMLGTVVLSARPSLPRLAIAVGAGQLVFDLACSALGTAAAATADAHVHDLVVAPLTTAPHAHADDALMWLGHAVAGLLTLALLRGAESAAWRVLTELARLVLSPFRESPASPVEITAARPAISTRPARLSSRILISAASRRGPPLSVAF